MAMNAKDLVSVVDELPIDLKLQLIDKLLESIFPPQSEADELWRTEVERRIDEVENGAVHLVPGDEVLARVRERFGK